MCRAAPEHNSRGHCVRHSSHKQWPGGQRQGSLKEGFCLKARSWPVRGLLKADAQPKVGVPRAKNPRPRGTKRRDQGSRKIKSFSHVYAVLPNHQENSLLHSPTQNISLQTPKLWAVSL